MTDVKCPICDAEPGEPCYDPIGTDFDGKHEARRKAEIAASVEKRQALRDART